MLFKQYSTQCSRRMEPMQHTECTTGWWPKSSVPHHSSACHFPSSFALRELELIALLGSQQMPSEEIAHLTLLSAVAQSYLGIGP
ncbi:hypothetical protein BKA93DRAFT_789992 [Sparassis latifolia]